MVNKTGLWATGLAAGLLLVTTASQANAEQEGPLFEQGQTIFNNNCVQCHQSSGEGMPPTFPALRDNANLSDPALIVNRVHTGEGTMPAFPDLDAEQIAAVASYIRNAWSNDFGPVTPQEVESILETLDKTRTEAQRTIWDGVFTEDQAEDTRLLYLGACASCHGSRLNGAADEPDMGSGPPLTGPVFLRNWNGRTLGALFDYTRTAMPVRNPGQFSDQQYIDIIAYMLSYGDAPEGDERLEPDLEVLNNIVIQPRPDNN